MRMAEVMKTDWWQVEILPETLEQPGQLVTVEMSSVGLSEYPPLFLPCGADSQTVLRLSDPMPLELCDDDGRNPLCFSDSFRT